VCIVSQSDVREELKAAARRTIYALENVPEYSATATQLRPLLDASEPLVTPSSEPVPQQMTAAALMEYRFRDYPSVLEDCIGPPLRIGPDTLLGYVSAQCALSALRHNELQSALSALFLTSLSSSQLEQPAVEALHHILLETDTRQSVGLLTLPARRAGTSATELFSLRQRHQLRFATTAVQIIGVFGPPTW
jgi:hypothetical protein